MPNPLGVVSNPEYFSKIVQSICGRCHLFCEIVESLTTLQGYVDSSKAVYEKTINTKVQEINELVSSFNALLLVFLPANRRRHFGQIFGKEKGPQSETAAHYLHYGSPRRT